MARFFTVDLLRQQQANAVPARVVNGQKLLGITNHRKIVYIAPSKALCEERYADWSSRLSFGGIRVALVTGDTAESNEAFRDLATSHVVVTTPEKFDSLTRRWTENFYLFATFKLFLVDEVHLLADESRGCCLESVLCRAKSIQQGAMQVPLAELDIEMSR